MISRLSLMKLKTLKWCTQHGMKNQKKELKKLSLQNVDFVFVARHRISVSTKLNLALGKY